ncbi:hypothetical protein [Mucilaginibacter antarcticus]|uniref:Outer membrane protein with beta-barrel domain n=1 Tax=Mucilaginibacter antarcticus TaxID=1855725 RepID=A0ABW5XT58_9SPHI
MKKEKGIDDIFKHSLQDPVNEPEFAAHDWDAFENMLDNKAATGGRVLWLRYLSAAAAVIIIAFCWWMFKPTATEIQQSVVKNKKENQSPVIDTLGGAQPQIAIKQPVNNGASTNDNTSQNKRNNNNTTDNQAVNVAKAANSNNSGRVDRDGLLREKPTAIIASKQPQADDFSTGDMIIAAQPVIVIAGPAQPTSMDVALIKTDTKSGIRSLTANTVADVRKANPSALRPQFALSILASPEVNGIGSLRSGSRGTNVGMMFTVGIKKFTLSTGANYTVKPYSVPYSQYPSSYSYKNTPETVTADCRMLDIPINLGYQVYNRSGNKITLGTGVSSYIMMHETYTYDYAAGAKVYGPSYYAVQGKSKYPFSIMNVQATYERQINSKVGLSLQPYYKIPLSAIGYSQVRVQTFGVAVGLNWNINQLTKPK